MYQCKNCTNYILALIGRIDYLSGVTDKYGEVTGTLKCIFLISSRNCIEEEEVIIELKIFIKAAYQRLGVRWDVNLRY